MTNRKASNAGRIGRFIDKLDRIIDSERTRQDEDALSYVEIMGLLASKMMDIHHEMCEPEEED